MRKTGKALAEFYKIDVRSSYYHNEGNWYWNLWEFPAAYFDADGCGIFKSEEDYAGCVYLSIGPRNTGVRSKNVGMGISDIPEYRKLTPPPSSLF